ncbi:MAG: hypothetical protein LUF34_04140 [Lachnospiraceae bacterium]|nr:hypothetical protein [Lachnospiraceae bacterium]
MNKESEMERLPGWLDAHRESLPTVHIYLIGSGPREARYIQQIALYDVDAQFTLLGEIENVYPLLRACDGLIFSEKEKNPEIEIAAEIFGIPRIRFSRSELDVSAASGAVKKRCKTETNESVWQDRERFIQILEGEMPQEMIREEETIR